MYHLNGRSSPPLGHVVFAAKKLFLIVVPNPYPSGQGWDCAAIAHSHEVWVRRGGLAPVNHEDPLVAWRVSRGLSGVHRATPAEAVKQLEDKEQTTGD